MSAAPTPAAPRKRHRRQRRDHDIGAECDAPREGAMGRCGAGGGVLVPSKLSEINAVVAEACRQRAMGLPQPRLPPSTAQAIGSALWGEWLWGCNPGADCPMDILLNRCHMIGLALARYGGASSPPDDRSAVDILGGPAPPGQADSMLVLLPGPVGRYSLRDLRDAVQNLQLHWGGCEGRPQAVDVAGIDGLVDALFRRFGVLASGAGWPGEVMNDQGGIEDGTSSGGWLGAPTQAEGPRGLHMNRICIRRFLNVFVVLYRHMYMHRMAHRIEGGDTGGITINVHHAVAGADAFDDMSMCWDLMPAARLNYIHDFPGMYNCVSQVVYFHNSKYERRAQRRDNFDALVRGEYEAIQALPCLCQMYPDIEVLYEEDDFSPLPGRIKHEAAWVMAGKALYLLVRGRGLLYSPNPVVALASHIQASVC